MDDRHPISLSYVAACLLLNLSLTGQYLVAPGDHSLAGGPGDGYAGRCGSLALLLRVYYCDYVGVVVRGLD